jgi:uncharacterized membrane protein
MAIAHLTNSIFVNGMLYIYFHWVFAIFFQAANQVLLLFGPIENPRWLPAGDII